MISEIVQSSNNVNVPPNNVAPPGLVSCQCTVYNNIAPSGLLTHLFWLVEVDLR